MKSLKVKQIHKSYGHFVNHLGPVWIARSRFNFHVCAFSASFFFFIFFFKTSAWCTIHVPWTVHQGIWTVKKKWTIIFHTFKNYFTIMFSVFIFQQNKLYQNEPLILFSRVPNLIFRLFLYFWNLISLIINFSNSLL